MKTGTGSGDRKARLAAQLRANLRKRRDQARKRESAAEAKPCDETAVIPPQTPEKPAG